MSWVTAAVVGMLLLLLLLLAAPALGRGRLMLSVLPDVLLQLLRLLQGSSNVLQRQQAAQKQSGKPKPTYT